jgi:hypothetical protein
MRRPVPFTLNMVGENGPLQGVLSGEVIREVNDRLAEIQTREGDEVLTLLCECAGPLCAERVAVERRHFSAMREKSEPVLAPSHHEATA